MICLNKQLIDFTLFYLFLLSTSQGRSWRVLKGGVILESWKHQCDSRVGALFCNSCRVISFLLLWDGFGSGWILFFAVDRIWVRFNSILCCWSEHLCYCYGSRLGLIEIYCLPRIELISVFFASGWVSLRLTTTISYWSGWLLRYALRILGRFLYIISHLDQFRIGFSRLRKEFGSIQFWLG